MSEKKMTFFYIVTRNVKMGQILGNFKDALRLSFK